MDELYYLQDSRQIVGNCFLWWAKGGNGYTSDIDHAATFSKEEALRQNALRETDIPWPQSYVEKTASRTVDSQRVDHQRAVSGLDVPLNKPKPEPAPRYRCNDCGRWLSEKDFFSGPYNNEPCPHCRDGRF